MKTVLLTIVALVVIALILFPEFRKKLYVLFSGFLNVFVQDIAKTPEGANAVYNEAIEEERELYRKACDILNKVSGELDAAKTNLAHLESQLKQVEDSCEKLIKMGRDSDAMIYAEKREDILNDIANVKSIIAEYEPMVVEAKATAEQREKNLRKLKKDQKEKVSRMKLDIQTKQVHEDMDELRNDRATHKLLDAVNEGSSDLRKEAIGARIVHQNKNSTKMAQIEKSVERAKTNDYIDELKKKYERK